MKINTGKSPITLMTLLAIWSISLVVNLPGLAVTPMLDSLKQIFPHTTELEEQLLTSVPNLMIIPFVLLSGKLSLSKSKVAIVVLALAIFTGAAVLYLICRTMWELILVSAMLGVGAGLLIPLAAGLLADTFVGKYRMKQLGIKSGISNIALVIATFIVGWLSGPGSGWRLPFLVYLISVIPLAMSPFLKGIPQTDLQHPLSAAELQARMQHSQAELDAADSKRYGLGKVKNTFILSRVWSIIAVYLFIGYATMAFSYSSPYYMEGVGLSATDVGTVTAFFFLAIFLPGFLLPYVVKVFKQQTFLISGILMAAGLVLMIVTHWFWLMCVSAFLSGWGYGTIQPLLYDKSTYATTMPRKATQALSFTLTANYVGVMITPFIIKGFQAIFGATHDNAFPFWFNGILAGLFVIVIIWKRKAFVFDVNDEYYAQQQEQMQLRDAPQPAAATAQATTPAPAPAPEK